MYFKKTISLVKAADIKASTHPDIALLSPGRPEEFHHQSPTEPCVK
ncbi:hypothetical protein SBF1_1760004 [Candidatus Desulfosporosinus infrequens]|uniref:Uncharacterized protein n=1 Tax=Candidatus Desulfosporosinus infrequens TaxID=2043169 RepID=A0A2U3KC32_9FIRM|nr:hypothetical protein SBF1_1760004 [Candidatus Desulfosporosinus infrequens]